MANKPITFQNLNLGGISDSLFQGPANSVRRSIGLDLISDPGIIKVRQKLKNINIGPVINKLPKVGLACSNGNTYYFSSEDGQIWQGDTSNVLTLVYTVAPKTGGTAILGAAEYFGYLYFATQNWLHRIRLEGLSNWNANTEANWQELNLDQEELGSDLSLYHLPVGAVSELDANKMPIYFYEVLESGIALNVQTPGTGDWTVKLHDATDAEIATATIVHGSMATGWIFFPWSGGDFNVDRTKAFHIHIYSTVGDGIMYSDNTDSINHSLDADGNAIYITGGNIRLYTESDTEFHQMITQNLVLYIADRRYVHQVERDNNPPFGHVFSLDALDVEEPQRIKCLGKLGTPSTDIYLGTIINNNVNSCKLVRWDTWSSSFIGEMECPEAGINCIIPAVDHLLVNAGLAGRFYTSKGGYLEPLKQIPGDYSHSQTCQVNPEAGTYFNGLPTFGVSNIAGNPTEQGVYTFGSVRLGYPTCLNLDYPISARSAGNFVLSGLQIGAVFSQGNNLYVTWKSGSTIGVDVIDYTTKLEKGYFESRALMLGRSSQLSLGGAYAGYKSLPASTSLLLERSVNYGAFTAWDSFFNNTVKMQYESVEQVTGNVIQIRLTINTNGNSTPEVDQVAIDVPKQQS